MNHFDLLYNVKWLIWKMFEMLMVCLEKLNYKCINRQITQNRFFFSVICPKMDDIILVNMLFHIGIYQDS